MSAALPQDHALSAEASGILQQLISHRIASRLFEKDPTLWGPEAAAEAAERLNWVNPFDSSFAVLDQAEALRARHQDAGITRIVLCGMGGSSLGPEVLARWADVPLTLLDSTHPDVVNEQMSHDLKHTAVVVSSKSGSTIETRSHLACFEQAFAAAGIPASERISVVTDPGSALEQYAQSQGYTTFAADPHVGGRFSVLTAFGVVPGTLAGVDMRQVLTQAQDVASLLSSDNVKNPANQLATLIFSGLPTQYVLATAEEPGQNWGLGDWIEQLVAESTGKSGVGILPISLPQDAPDLTQDFPGAHVRVVSVHDSTHTSVGLEHERIRVAGQLGAQFLLWEVATAILGHLMQIDPFNQPDVESAKIAARNSLAAKIQDNEEGERVHRDLSTVCSGLTEHTQPNSYLAIQAYLNPTPKNRELLGALRTQLVQSLHVPVALGWGPRYLHSTGQLHKGGPKTGVFLQVIDNGASQYEIPRQGQGFAELIRAQSTGDRTVLEEHGSAVFVVFVSDLEAYADARMTV